MNRKKYLLAVFTITVLLFPGCDDVTNIGQPPSNGDLNTSMYVAIGNSLTAGFQSGALFESGQKYSYPNLIAQQIGTLNFVQPLNPEPGTGPRIILKSLNPPTLVTSTPSVNQPTNSSHPAPYNNLGIPGAILFDAIDTASTLDRSLMRSNPFYLMVMRDQRVFGKSLVEQATKLQPTFITFWLGNNDVLGYAASGGVKGTNIGLDGNPPQTRPTEIFLFEQTYEKAITELKKNNPNAKIVVATIPEVGDIPLFTTVPKKVPNPQSPGSYLDIYYKKNSGVVVKVEENDLVLLTAQTVLGVAGKGLSPQYPLESVYVLDSDEYNITHDALTQYNLIIRKIAAKNKLAVADIYGEFADIKRNKRRIAGEILSADFITGGIFSLDGIHPTAKGQGIIANTFLKVINTNFNANIPLVNIAALPGLPAPLEKTGEPFRYTLDMKIPAHTFDYVINLFTQ